MTGKRDENFQVVLMGVSSVDGTSLPLKVDPVTGRLLCTIVASVGNNATPSAQAKRDDNFIPVLMGETNDTNRTPTPFSIESNGGLMTKGN